MMPTTLRLPENTLEELDREAREYGFDNRTEYIRHILDNRSVVIENTQENTVENTNLTERVAELEKRVDALETQHESTGPTEHDKSVETTSTPEHDPQDVLSDSSDENILQDVEALDLAGGADSPAGRDALLAMYEYIRDTGRAQKSDFVDNVYPDHKVGYSSEESWWQAVGRDTAHSEGFVTLAKRRNDLQPPEGRGSQYFEFIG